MRKRQRKKNERWHRFQQTMAICAAHASVLSTEMDNMARAFDGLRVQVLEMKHLVTSDKAGAEQGG